MHDCGKPDRYLIRRQIQSNTCGDEIGADLGEARGFLGGLDVKGDDWNLEYLGPPLDEVEAMVLCRIATGSTQAKGDVVGATFAERHGSVAGLSGIHTDDGVRAQLVTRGRVDFLYVVTPREVCAVGSKNLRERRVVFDKSRDIRA